MADSIETLRQTLYDKERSLADVMNKLQALHSHYSELHSAYNALNKSVQKDAPVEYAGQITQLQTVWYPFISIASYGILSSALL